jgi:predicted MFS family arabinose efflux permease
LLLLLMVAAVTVADDPILVLGPTVAHHLGGSQSWAGWFIAALGAGSVVGSVRRSRHMPRLRLAATALAALGVFMMVFVLTPFIWVSLAAALCAGIACLVANSMTRTLLSQTAGKAQMAPVMAVWAIAWAGSKPLASLTDGSLAGLIGYRLTGVLLAVPAMLPLAYLIVRHWLKRGPSGQMTTKPATFIIVNGGTANQPRLRSHPVPARGPRAAEKVGREQEVTWLNTTPVHRTSTGTSTTTPSPGSSGGGATRIIAQAPSQSR